MNQRLRLSTAQIAWLGLAVAVTLWVVVVTRLVVHRHNMFATFDFDLGIHDQSLWLLSKGRWFNTVCGLPVFGHHAMFMYYLLVPFVWLGGGPNLWNTFQVLALGLAAIPVFLVARRATKSHVMALGFAVAWLLLPTVTYLAWETFHPETMAIPFLLMGYHYATTRPDGAGRHVTRHNLITVAWFAAAMLWKEDISLAVMGIAVLLILRKRLRFGLALLGGAALYFLVFAVWMVPTLAGETSAYGMLYGDLGKTPFEVARTSLTEPSLFFRRLSDNNALGYVGQLAAPLGFLPLAAPAVILMGVPQFFINILTTADFTWAMMYHYQAVPIVAMILGAIETTGWITRRKQVLGTVAVTLALASSLIAANAWGILPGGNKYNAGYWPHGDRSTAGLEAALERIGPDDAVSAHYSFVPHASQRKLIYTFPNPWIRTNFLGDPSLLESPSKITWLVIPDNTLGEQAADLLESLVATGEYGDAQTVEGVTTYRRLKP
jgi:uncharacterized membrane protein